MEQNEYTSLGEEMDAEQERPTKKRRYDKDADLAGRPLPEIIYALREAASYYIREVDAIPDLTRGGGTLFKDVGLEGGALYIWEKRFVPSLKKPIRVVYGREDDEDAIQEDIYGQNPDFPADVNKALHDRIEPWTDADTAAIAPLRERIPRIAYGKTLTSKSGQYVGTKYFLPFSPRWNKHDLDDIRLAESLAGAVTSGMGSILSNYDAYTRYTTNNASWIALLKKIIADEWSFLHAPALRNSSVLTLLSFANVRDAANELLRTVSNVERKMATLYDMISQDDNASAETRAGEVRKIMGELARNDEEPIGRSGAGANGGLMCDAVVNGNIVYAASPQRDNDVQLARAFNATKATYMDRVRSLNTYLAQHLRFAIKTSPLPLYVEKVAIEFSDRWKGILRDSMVRYTANPSYKNVIRTYRDLFLIEHNEPMIALFAEFVSKRADNTQVTMRPQTNHFTLTHYQLDRNKVQYKAKERELDKLIAAHIEEIRREKRKIL